METEDTKRIEKLFEKHSYRSHPLSNRDSISVDFALEVIIEELASLREQLTREIERADVGRNLFIHCREQLKSKEEEIAAMKKVMKRMNDEDDGKSSNYGDRHSGWSV